MGDICYVCGKKTDNPKEYFDGIVIGITIKGYSSFATGEINCSVCSDECAAVLGVIVHGMMGFSEEEILEHLYEEHGIPEEVLERLPEIMKNMDKSILNRVSKRVSRKFIRIARKL